MAKATKMHEVIALHDLSYIDHEGNAQYRRQSSKPFELDDDNFQHFAKINAVKPLKEAIEDLEKTDAARREANLRRAEAVRAGEPVVDDFGEIESPVDQVAAEAEANRAQGNKSNKGKGR